MLPPGIRYSLRNYWLFLCNVFLSQFNYWINYHNFSIWNLFSFFNYFFYSKFFLNGLLQFFFIKTSNDFFPIKLTNNMEQYFQFCYLQKLYHTFSIFMYIYIYIYIYYIYIYISIYWNSTSLSSCHCLLTNFWNTFIKFTALANPYFVWIFSKLSKILWNALTMIILWNNPCIFTIKINNI